MMTRLYGYKGCDSCRKAIKWLAKHSIPFEEIAIRESPPSLAELNVALASYDGALKRLFNVSGLDYRSGGYKDRLPEMSEAKALAELGANGNLIKRPFVVSGSRAIVGFKEAEWEGFFS